MPESAEFAPSRKQPESRSCLLSGDSIESEVTWDPFSWACRLRTGSSDPGLHAQFFSPA